MPDGLYDSDILTWSETQADLLRRVASGQRVNGVDWEHVVEEIADVGISQLNAVHSLFMQATLHLIKIYLLPNDLARNHWEDELAAFLGSAGHHFVPSMRQRIDLATVWRRAGASLPRRLTAMSAFTALPSCCPWTLDELLNGDQDALLAALPRFATQD